MSSETFRAIFPRVRELLALDSGLDEVEWELIGGEITSLPVEYWQENLPYALDQCRDINAGLKTPGSINLLSNMIFSNEVKRQDYLDLFEKYGDRDEMCLYTSWEPDTNRFGKNMALFERWKETVKEANVRQKILDVILTKETVAKGPEYLLETFLPLGINDFSIKMISPYGSGRSFWQPNMVPFDKMSDYLCKLLDMVPEGITFTPADEMSGAVFRGTSYQCIGNFRYDLAIEPNGLTTFNANQTTDEASVGSGLITVDDPDWSWKVLSDNTTELDNKLSVYHDYCFQCEFHSYCAGGWYHYRVAAPEDVRAWDSKDCPGYKNLWRKVHDKFGTYNRHIHVHRESLYRAREANGRGASPMVLSETRAHGQAFYEWLMKASGLTVDLSNELDRNKPMMERIWAYQAVGTSCLLSPEAFKLLSPAEQRTLIEHVVYDDFHNLSIDSSVIWAWADFNLNDPLSALLLRGEKSIAGKTPSDSLITADHNVELLRWVLGNGRQPSASIGSSDPVITATVNRLRSEARISNRSALS
tara:strand:+ start:16258 stop:17850 length:1593 start_codon:yes stop_codon:yes gene_type:complete